MKRISLITLTLVTAVFFVACGAPADNKPAANDANAKSNTNVNTAKPVASAPAKDALMATESKAWEAWKAKDGKFFEDYLMDNAIGMGNKGRSDKAAIIKRISDPTCDVNDFSFAEEQMTLLGVDAALLTYKVTQDAKCDGKELPSIVRAATVLVRSGDKWKAAFHAEAAVVDPKAPPAKPADTEKATEPYVAEDREADSSIDTLIFKEKAIWEAWKDHDAKRIDDLTAKEISFINIFGTYFATKADALKDWTSPGCDVKSVSVTDAWGTRLSPTAAILTFRGGADGTCFGQKVGPIRGTSVYVKDGDVWKWAFGINLPAD